MIIVLGVAYAANKIAGSRWVRKPWEVPGVESEHSDSEADLLAGGVQPEQPVSAGTATRSSADSAAVGFAPLESLTPLQQRLAALRPDVSAVASRGSGTVRHF